MVLLSALPVGMFAQPILTPLLTNGPAANRITLVVLAEGYTINQTNTFLINATNAVSALLNTPPYSNYSNYFNAQAIFVASTETGSDHPANNVYRNTYFNSSYHSNDILITIPPHSFDPVYANGQGKVDSLLQMFGLTNAAMTILIVNDVAGGGSDGSGKVAIVSRIQSALQYNLPHEAGHVLANLGDEYTTPNPGYPDSEEPNTTRETNRAAIKWKAWIADETPVPTPPSYMSVVGLFEGAHYHSNGWYRPKFDCAMRSSGSPFCEVCAEALVISFYERVHPIDAFLPATTNLSVISTQEIAFSIATLQPGTASLQTQWRTNGVPLSGATNLVFYLPVQAMSNGNHTVSVTVHDGTPLVRNDPSNRLSQTLTWTLDVSIPQLRLDNTQRQSGGVFAFRVTGHAPAGVVIQGSTNLLDWTRLATNALVGGQLFYTNQNAGALPYQFFRASTPP